MAEHLADDIDRLKRDAVAHHDRHVGAQLVAHGIEHPPCKFELLGKAEAKLVVGLDQGWVERRRIAADRALLIVLFGAKFGLDGIAKGLRATQMGRSAEIMLSTHRLASLHAAADRTALVRH
jgi:hypothetical protein